VDAKMPIHMCAGILQMPVDFKLGK
jgi:hypothetical protein